LSGGEAIVLVLAQAPNRRGQTMLTEWMGVHLNAAGQTQAVLTLEESCSDRLWQRIAGQRWPSNPDGAHPGALPAVVQTAERHLKPIKQAFDADCRARLGRELHKLKTLQDKHFTQLELDFSKGIEQVNAARRKQRENDTADLFKNYQQWIKDTLELDDRAQITIVAVLAA
jgi:hypothetical protein